MSAPVRNNSSSSVSSTSSSINERRSSSIAAPFKNIGHKLAQHHRDVQLAYEAYYGVPLPKNAATAHASRRTSGESQRELLNDEYYEAEANPKAAKSKNTNAWQRVKQAAKEHHEGVNSAYRAYYGVC